MSGASTRPTVLVTGGTGYIGSHTSLELLQNGFNVVVLDNFFNSSKLALTSLEELSKSNASLGAKFLFLQADTREERVLAQAMGDHQVDAVIHFAGLKSVAESFQKPTEYWDNNVGGTMALSRAMISTGVKHLVFSSSALVYGQPKVIPIPETSPISAVNSYGRTKVVCEEFLTDLAHAHSDFNVSLLRYFNPVGAHPSAKMGEAPLGTPNNLMPLVCQVASGQRDRLSIYGDDYETPDGTCIRDYIHVMDLAHGHVLTLKAMMGLSSNQIPKGLNVFNFGSGRGASVTELVECFERVNALKLNKQIAPRREGDVHTLIADTTRAREMLGWTAQRDLSEMCKDAWAWQQQNMKP